MAVLPPERLKLIARPLFSPHHDTISAPLVPIPLQNLMLAKNSPLRNFYSSDFRVDLNGKKYDWQGVVLLPFIDEKKLLDAVKENTNFLSPQDLARNMLGRPVLFIHTSHPLAQDLIDLYGEEQSGEFFFFYPLSIHLTFSQDGNRYRRILN